MHNSTSQNNPILPVEKEIIYILCGKFGAGKSIASDILKKQGYEFLTSYAGYALDLRYIKRGDGKFEIEAFSGRLPRPNENNSDKLDIFKDGIDNPLNLIPENKRVVDNLEDALDIQNLEKLTQENKAKYTPDKIDKTKLSDAEKIYEFLDLEELNKKVENKEVLITASISSPKEIGKFGNGIRCYSLVQIAEIRKNGKKICCECEDTSVPSLIKTFESNLPNIEVQAINLSPTIELASTMLILREGKNAPARISGNEKTHTTLTDPNKNQDWIKLTQEGKIKKIIITSRVADRDITLKQSDGKIVEVKKGQEFSVKKTGEIVVNNIPRLKEESKNAQYITKFIQLNELEHKAQYELDLAYYNCCNRLSNLENNRELIRAVTELRIAKKNLEDLGKYGTEGRKERLEQEQKNKLIDSEIGLNPYNEELLYFEDKSDTKSAESRKFLEKDENKLNLRIINVRKEFAQAKQQRLELQSQNNPNSILEKVEKRNNAAAFLEKYKELNNSDLFRKYLTMKLDDKNFESFKKCLKREIVATDKNNLEILLLINGLKSFAGLKSQVNNANLDISNEIQTKMGRALQNILEGQISDETKIKRKIELKIR